MKRAGDYRVVFVTAPDLKTGRRLAQAVLQGRLAACVNLIPKVESHYWWLGKLERGWEVLLVLKTTKARLPALERCILAHHPYDTPEFLALPLHVGTGKYLDWITASVS